ncbi:hypothetical protein F3Y22_tig00000773pilonHSYRG00225 [Hibiscus syriacus]|uniref:DNA (Cytosine-5)-methyltransferase DRM1/2 n=1 Tax=Hibiscus syriacus TaxID=106335 RepID=A0A6A3CYY0_HIBSY|nr:hypothetical protein F3Y22_tig00000773pilonHSYRG00225 [Hibiscus syriacus]
MKRSFRMISQILIVLSDTEEILNSDSDEENKLLFLTKMGYSEVEASITMERCGPDSSIAELTDFICSDQMAKVADALLPVEDQINQRTLPEDAIVPPYFYYENVVLTPVGVWTKMSRNKVAPLEPDEVEMHLGFPKNHTRGGGSARDMFPSGINVLSLFSKINDAKVAFYCFGIPLKTDVQELNDDRLEQLMSRFVEFDLVVGDIPCNNLFLQ